MHHSIYQSPHFADVGAIMINYAHHEGTTIYFDMFQIVKAYMYICIAQNIL